MQPLILTMSHICWTCQVKFELKICILEFEINSDNQNMHRSLQSFKNLWGKKGKKHLTKKWKY